MPVSATEGESFQSWWLNERALFSLEFSTMKKQLQNEEFEAEVGGSIFDQCCAVIAVPEEEPSLLKVCSAIGCRTVLRVADVHRRCRPALVFEGAIRVCQDAL